MEDWCWPSANSNRIAATGDDSRPRFTRGARFAWLFLIAVASAVILQLKDAHAAPGNRLEGRAGGGALVAPQDLLLIEEQEPNNSCESPQNLGSPTLPLRVEGYKTQGSADAVDFYEFSAAPGTQLRVTLDGDFSKPVPLMAHGVGFFPSNCPATPSASSFESPAQIEFTVPADGKSIIGVTACCDLTFSGSGTIEGAYQLSVEASVTPTGQFRTYVLNSSAGTVSVIDTGTNTVIGLPITVNALPTGIAATPDGSRVYLTDDDNMVSVIETATNSVIGHITVGMGSAGIAIGPDGTRAYVTNYGDNSVSVLDTATNETVGAPIPVGTNPIAIAVTPNGARAYVANYGDNSVSVIDTALNTVVGAPILAVASWPSPCALAVTPDGAHVYVVNASGSAVVISTATNAVVGAPVSIGDMNLVCIAFTPDGTRGYVTYHNNTVAVLDPATNTLLGPPITIPGPFPSAPTGLAITPDGARAYVANNASNTVSVIDTATNTLVGPLIDVGAGPFAVAIAPVATPTQTPTATRTPTGPTPTRTRTATRTPTHPTPTRTRTATRTPTQPTPTSTLTATRTATRRASSVVGSGTPESCTEAELAAALVEAETVTFDCGASGVTITVTSTKTISTDTTIDGGGLITISGGNNVGVFSVNGGVELTVQNLTIANGSASSGGAISNGGTLAVTNSTFSGNGAAFGGAISNGGILTITDCTFSGNYAHTDICGDFICGGVGGAIFSSSGNNGSGTLTVINSTFSGNGAYRVGGAINNYGALTVINSTFSGNYASAAGTVGGGIVNGGDATVINSTFFGNSAAEGGGIFNNGTLTISNSMIANSANGSDCSGSLSDGGHNLIEDANNACGLTNGVNGNIVGVDPQLDPDGLEDNGGPTQTIALSPGSPALSGGDPEVCANPPVNGLDQRGHVRPGTGHVACSIGAYEADVPATPTGNATPTATDTPTPVACVGDCDSDGAVAINELVVGVGIVLGEKPLSACPTFADPQGVVNIARLIRGVKNALGGCGAG